MALFKHPRVPTLEYTNAKARELQAICKEMDEITSVSSLAGYEVLTEGRGFQRRNVYHQFEALGRSKTHVKQIIEELEERGRKIANIKLEFFEPPAVPGFGAAGGFSLNLLDKNQHRRLQSTRRSYRQFLWKLSVSAKSSKACSRSLQANYPQYEIVIDNDIAMQKGVSIRDAMDNLSIVVGSTWEQGFVRFGQFYKVYVQSAPEFRRYPDDFANMFVKNDRGEMVPYSAFMQLKKKQGLNEISRYNLYPTAPIQGAPAAGYSSGQAIAAIQEVAAQTLPHGYGIDWQGLSYDEAKKGNTAVYIFLIVVVFVYMVLVGQYESFILLLLLSFPSR